MHASLTYDCAEAQQRQPREEHRLLGDEELAALQGETEGPGLTLKIEVCGFAAAAAGVFLACGEWRKRQQQMAAGGSYPQGRGTTEFGRPCHISSACRASYERATLARHVLCMTVLLFCRNAEAILCGWR